MPAPAYGSTVENSVYVAAAARGRGIGRALLSGLIDRCRQAGKREMIAAIGDSANLGSIALHRALGFREAGVLRDVGRKAWPVARYGLDTAPAPPVPQQRRV